jgi:hypothetical protein
MKNPSQALQCFKKLDKNCMKNQKVIFDFQPGISIADG